MAFFSKANQWQRRNLTNTMRGYPGQRCKSTTQGVLILGRIHHAFAFILALGITAATPSAHADYVVPANASVALNGGSLNLACSDLIVGGNFSLGSGSVTGARNVVIQAGGSLNGGSGALSLAGNFSNSGSFSAGTGKVNFVDIAGCAPTGTISGSNSFYDLSFVTTSPGGKTYAFAAGSTQVINNVFTVRGTAAGALQLTSSVAGQPAFINLLITGAQSMASLGVVDLTATGVGLAPNLINLAPANGASAIGWFQVLVVPTLSSESLISLALMLMLLVYRAAFRRPSVPASRARS